MKRNIVMATLLIALFSFVCFAEELGNVNIPKDVHINKVAVPAGTYTVDFSVNSNSEPVLALWKDGQEIVKDIAVSKVSEKAFSKIRIRYEETAKDKGDILVGRVFVGKENMIYLLMCEK